MRITLSGWLLPLPLLASAMALANGEPTSERAMNGMQADTAEVVTIRTVDMRGRPPYRRTVETLTVTELARFEELEAAEQSRAEQVPPSQRKRPLPIRMR